MSKISLLIVEDDKNAGFLITDNLKNYGFEVELAKNGVEGLCVFKKRSFDMCVVDIMMPQMDGYEFSKHIRALNPNISFIFLTARSLKADKIEGFRYECDDYITKPFEVDELVCRIKAILRRKIVKRDNYTKIIEFGKYSLFTESRKLLYNNIEISLAKKECEILIVLLQNMNNLVTRNHLMQTIWGKEDFYISKSLDVFLTHIRKHISQDNRFELQNIYGSGYILFDKEQI